MNVIENKLYIGDIPASEIAKKFGTPAYVYDEEVIRLRYREFKASLTCPNVRIHYACKANTNPKIMEILREEGAGIDAVSPGEIMIALKAGFKPEDIVYTSTSVTDEEMKFVIDKNVMINADSLSQLERFGKLNSGGKISLRINPAVGAGHHDHVITGGPDSKFGIWVDDLELAKEIAHKYELQIVGIHQHIGSGILDVDKFMQAIGVILEAAKGFKDLKFIDLGGGLGVPYKPDQKQVDMKEFGRQVSEALINFSNDYGEVQFIFEPGRYLVAEAGVLLCTINTIKTTPRHKFVGVDTGFNHLIRPMAYGSYHPIVKINCVESNNKEKVLIAGNICETGDVLTMSETGSEDREMPVLNEGDVLAVMVAGAYGYSMSSTYNTRPRPVEVLVSGKKISVIRKETLKDLVDVE